MIKLLLLVIAVVLVSFLFLGFNIFIRRKSFPETEIGRNKAMRERGITCPRCDELKTKHNQRPESINPDKLRIIRE